MSCRPMNDQWIFFVAGLMNLGLENTIHPGLVGHLPINRKPMFRGRARYARSSLVTTPLSVTI